MRIGFSAILAFILLPFNLQASTTEGPEIFIRNISTESYNIVNDGKMSESQKETRFNRLVENAVDTQWVGRFILGKNWHEATDSQRQRFIRAYKNFLLSVYVPKFKGYDSSHLKVLRSITKDNKVFFVQTEIKTSDNKTANVDFRVVDKNGDFFITDVIAEGVSFINTQRSEVNSAISQKGLDVFIKELEEKNNV